MTTPQPIETQRLLLRPMSLDDAEALHAIYADPVAMTWWSHGPHDSLDQTRERIASAVGEGDWRAWVITLKPDPRAIGTLHAHEKRQGHVFEIGYSLARSHWRRGIAREAVSALIDLLFGVEHARRIFADTDPDNDGSNALLAALGFTLEGRLRAEWETHLGVRDTALWGLLRDEWQPLR